MINRPLKQIDVISIGIGAMVGAGIFVLIGQVSELVDHYTWLSFMIAGLISLLIGYVYAKLAVYYPTNGGLIDYFRNTFSKPLFVTLAFLYIVTLVLTIALVARAFGLFAASWINSNQLEGSLNSQIYTVAILCGLAFLNMLSNHAVGRTESFLVILKLAILLVFICAGFLHLEPVTLLDTPPSAATMFSSLGLTFFAYAGFNMMANAADKVNNPAKVMPRAFLIAIGLTMVLYIVLAILLVSNLSMEELKLHAETSIAYAAYPALGKFGFILVSIGALLATSSAINATFFSLFNTLDSMGESGEIPKKTNAKLWRNATVANLSFSAMILLLALFFDISILADVVSFTFLISYVFVLFVAWRIRERIQLSTPFIAVTTIINILILIGFLYSLIDTSPFTLVLIALTVLVCYACALWRLYYLRQHEAQ